MAAKGGEAPVQDRRNGDDDGRVQPGENLYCSLNVVACAVGVRLLDAQSIEGPRERDHQRQRASIHARDAV